MTDKKYDGGKTDIELLFLQFPLALQAIPLAAMYGSTKYEDDTGISYKKVINGARRYASAGGRHKLARMSGEVYAEDSHVAHIIHEVWNHLAELEFYLIKGNKSIDPEWEATYEDDWKKQADKLKGIVGPGEKTASEVFGRTAAWAPKAVFGTKLKLLCTCDDRPNIKYCDGYCER